MIQFLNNIWISLSSENPELLNIIFFPLGFLEYYLFMSLFLNAFNIKTSKKRKFLYVILVSLTSTLSFNLIPSPFNILVNYSCIVVFIKLIFGLNLFKSFLSLVLSTFTFGILGILLQNPYIKLLNLTSDEFMFTPIYRLPYIAILYSIVFMICIFIKKFRNIHFSLDFLDKLDKRTLRILYVNLAVGFLTLCAQLIITAFYIDRIPIIINLLNFILLCAFMILSVYSFTRVIKLANTKRDLQNAEEYNKSLEILYDKVKGFKHDFDNIVSTLDGYIENNDMSGLKIYFDGLKKDCKITNNLSLINPRIINNPGIYSLLNNKYFKANELGITFDIEFFLNLDELNVNMFQFSRILGILLDNAIEEAIKCKEKVVKVSFLRENRNNRAVITVQNTYSNKDVDIDKIFKKGESGKENHSGIGLWEVKSFVDKSKNLNLSTSKSDQFFKQELFVYDLIL